MTPQTATPSASSRWQVVLPESIAWHGWGDELVVHVGDRAETHLLSATAGAILLAMLDSPEATTLEGLFERAFASVHITDLERVSMSATLEDFERLGLVIKHSA